MIGSAVPSERYANLSLAQRTLVAMFVVMGVWYLAWRPTSLNPDAMAFSIVLYAAELFGFLCAMLYLVMCSRLQRRTALPVPATSLGVEVVANGNDEADSTATGLALQIRPAATKWSVALKAGYRFEDDGVYGGLEFGYGF